MLHVEIVFLPPEDVFAFEAAERLTYVHSLSGKFDIDLSLAAMSTALGDRSMRVHRNWIVSTAHILAMEKDELGWMLKVGKGLDDIENALCIPVARDKVQRIREFLLKGTTGLRR